MPTIERYESEPSSGERDRRRFPPNHVRFHPLLRALSPLERWSHRVGFDPLRLTPSFARELARQQPLLTDLGSERELEALRELALQGYRGLDSNPFLSAPGRLMLRLIYLTGLKARPQVLAFQHKHAKFIAEHGRMVAPLMIAGLPRTGSTLLQRLLCQDPDTRSPRTYEMEAPLPPLRAGDDPLADPRIAQASSGQGLMRRMMAGFMEKFAESHLWAATEYEEALPYMLMHAGVPFFNAAQAGRDYARDAFASNEAMGPVLRYERRFFTMLDAYRPAKSHWIFKAPQYSPCLPQLFDTYPDARLVITHRNPLTVIPSVCRLMESWCIAFDREGTFDKHRFAAFTAKGLEPFVNAPMEFRDARPELSSQIFDCMYDELFADPIAMVRRIYDHFGLRYTQVFEDRMQRYVEDNRQGKYGRHRYSLEEYGLDATDLAERLSRYMTHYAYTETREVERATSLGERTSEPRS